MDEQRIDRDCRDSRTRVNADATRGIPVTELAPQFKDALSTIEPDDDKRKAATAHAEVRDILTADEGLKSLGIDPVLIGSYARNVSIKHVKDVDVFARLNDASDTVTPGAVLDTFETVLTDEYAERVERQHRSIKVDFPDFGLTVDAVPARPCGDNWEIPSKAGDEGRAQWVETNPLKLNDLTTEKNQAFLLNGVGIYVPIVKLVRQVRRTWLDAQPGGLFFELMTYWYFENDSPTANSVAGYLTLTLEYVAESLSDVIAYGLGDPTIEGQKISTKADKDDLSSARDKIGQASELARSALEDMDDCTSAMKWRTLLGVTSNGDEVFPLPGHCNADGTHKKSAAFVRGATRVPAGDDRYA